LVTETGERWGWTMAANGYRMHFGGDENVLYLGSGIGCINLWVAKND
jgi:hypothetical protein